MGYWSDPSSSQAREARRMEQEQARLMRQGEAARGKAAAKFLAGQEASTAEAIGSTVAALLSLAPGGGVVSEIVAPAVAITSSLVGGVGRLAAEKPVFATEGDVEGMQGAQLASGLISQGVNLGKNIEGLASQTPSIDKTEASASPQVFRFGSPSARTV